MMTDDLGPTGFAIWKAYGGDQLDAPAAALVRELARCADTCDRLNALIIGKVDAWARMVFDDMGEVHLEVDKLLDQRRNHQLALKQLVAEVRSAGLRPDTAKKPESPGVDPGDMLAAARKAKEDRERQLG